MWNWMNWLESLWTTDKYRPKMIKEISEYSENLIGSRCWEATNVITGTLRLYFGGWIFRQLSDGNLFISGEYDILIWSDWCLDSEQETLCDVTNMPEEIMYAVTPLIGDTVVDFVISPLTLNADVTFASGKVLRMFCDSTDDIFNWSIKIRDVGYYFKNAVVTKGEKKREREYGPFNLSALPKINMEERILAMNTKLSESELEKIAKEIMASKK
jgi:hypothetical protein